MELVEVIVAHMVAEKVEVEADLCMEVEVVV